MKTRVQRWGNSLAIRIPKAFADEIDLTENTDVNLDLLDNSLVVRKAPRKKYKLENLLASITPDQLHGEIDFGAPVGKEIIE